MKTSLPTATASEKRRFEIIKREIGCLVHPGTPADAHHLLSGGRRISHAATIPLCKQCHHDIHNRKRWFADTHGTDAQLLSRANRLVEQFERDTIGGAV